MIDQQINSLKKKLNALEVLKGKYSDLSISRDRWGKEHYSSKLVNTGATHIKYYHSCGCCEDAPLLVSPYLIENVEGEDYYIYGNPVCYVIGHKNAFWGLSGDQPREIIGENPFVALRENCIPEELIQKSLMYLGSPMNKVLYVGNVLESSGYSYAIEEAIKALFYAKIPVALRHINLCGQPQRKPSEILQRALNANGNDANILIIHSLPNYFEFDGRFDKCIGRFDFDTLNLKPTNWPKKCQLMDEIWTARPLTFHVKKNVVIPHPFDSLRTSFKLEPGVVAKQKGNKFVFYTIGEFVVRKNYEALLRIWYTTFSKKDNVQLVIKSSANGLSKEELLGQFRLMNENVIKSLKINPKHLIEPILIADKLTPLAIDQIHNDSDCFVSTSHAEGFCIPARDALAFGNPIIVPNHTAFQHYAHYQNVNRVTAIVAPCYEAFNQAPEILNGHDYWYNVDEYNFSQILRNTHKLKPPKNLALGEQISNDYSYETIGKLMKSQLCP